MTRFTPPNPGAPSVVHFPAIRRARLSSGLAVWSIEVPDASVTSTLLVLDRGSAADPPGRPGLMAVAADLLDEGAGDRDAIALADAFQQLGTHLEIDVTPDVTTIGVTSLGRVVPDVLALLSDVVQRPAFGEADVERVRDLRLSRLRQLSRSATAAADRVFLGRVFHAHPYGRGTLGTTAALESAGLDEARACVDVLVNPSGATLVTAGGITHSEVIDAAERTLAGWRSAQVRAGHGIEPPSAPGASRIALVDRPGAPQSELRLGHLGPVRATPDYHAFVTLNAVLGGQFSSRINRNLRETLAVTYGARTLLDMRREGSAFECQTSVQADATARSVAEIIRELRAVRMPGAISPAELDLAKASLTRGYALNFETPVQLARAAVQLLLHGLDDGVFDEFVPRIEGIDAAALTAAADRYLHPDACTVVVVGDRASCEAPLTELGLPIDIVTPEF